MRSAKIHKGEGGNINPRGHFNIGMKDMIKMGSSNLDRVNIHFLIIGKHFCTYLP